MVKNFKQMIRVKNSVVFVSLMVLTVSVFAWNPPTIQCIKLLNNNTRIHVDWESNPDCVHFKVYYFYVNGVLSDSLYATQTDNLYYHGGKDVNNIPSASQYNCYMVAVDSNENSCQSNTLQSITLTVTPNASHTAANIEWESPTTSFDNTWGNTFNLYKKRSFEPDFPAQPFASVPVSQLSYTDLADVCDASISYQVGISHFYMNGSTQSQCPFMTTIGTVDNMMDTVQPSAPVLDSVTVTPNNQVMLGFHETEPYMMAFLIYYINPNGTILLDSVFGQSFWIDPVIDPSNDSRSYRITAKDSCGTESPLTNNEQSNMVLHLKSTDACHRSASIQWSTYPNLINGIDHFEIMLSNDGGTSWVNLGSTTTNTFTIENLLFNTDYKVYVRVVNIGATVTASSNRITIRIAAEETEDFSYIRSVSVIEDQFIQIKVLTSGDTLPFEAITLQRSENGTDFEDFMTLNYQSGIANYVFSDSLADFSRNIYYYRTYIVNQCNTDAGYSNISHNILLHGENNAQTNVLSWPGYSNWDGGASDYYVMRKVENEELFNTIADVAPAAVNNYQDDISQLFESGSKFIYYIEAKENTNRYGFEETSYSNCISVIQPPTIYIPNAFRPMAGNNKVFKPINSFVSIDHYQFSIFTRSGECVFLTTNPQEGWDGRINGVIAPMNVYVYYLEYKMPDGTVMERTGTVTLVK